MAVTRRKRRRRLAARPALALAVTGLLLLLLLGWRGYADFRQVRLDRELGQAVIRNDPARMLRLLEEGADPDAPFALRHKDPWLLRWQLLQAWLRGRPAPDARELEHNSLLVRPILLAAGLGVKRDVRREMVDLLLRHGADINGASPGVVHSRPILLAAFRGDAAFAEFLLRRGADVNAVGRDGLTGLHYAASRGNAAMAQRLLSHGADPGRADAYGRTPLDLALKNRRAEAAAVLLAAGAR